MLPSGVSQVSRTLRVVVGLTLLIALVILAGPRRLGATLAAAEPAALAAAAVTYAASMLLRTWRFARLARCRELTLGPRPACRAYGLGMLLAAVTPGRVGQHVKALALVRRGAGWERAVAVTLVDQLLDLACMLALLPVATLYFGGAITGSAAWGVAALAALAVAGALGYRWGGERLQRAARELVAVGYRALGVPLALTIVGLGLYFLAVERLAAAVALPAGYTTMALATVLSALVEVVPVTVAGLGTREASLFALLHASGATLAQVIGLTVVIRGLHVALGGLMYGLGSDQDVVASDDGDAATGDSRPPRSPAIDPTAQS